MDNLTSTPHHQFFTAEKANSALVLVRPIVTELLNMHRRLTKVQFEIEALEDSAQRATDDNSSDEQLLDQLYAELHKLLDRISHNIEELHAIGCIFKDFQVGIVDFPTHFNGRDVYLCWQHGEAELSHWHELEDGFSERSPVNDYFLKHSSSETAVC